MSRRWFLALLAVVALAFAACSSGDGETVAAENPPVAEATPEQALETPVPRELPTPETADDTVEAEPVEADPDAPTHPPGDQESLADLLNPVVAEFNVVFTRGSLVERGPGVYEPSPDGNHLALYVEPLDPFSDEEFVINMWDIAAKVTPWVFDTWSGVQSYDICQEPYSAEPRAGVPPPVTQLDIDRAKSDTIDWEGGSLATLLTALRTDGGEMTLRVAPELQQTPSFVAALTDLDS